MTNTPTPAQELWLLDQELRQLDARRAQLLARRDWLLRLLAGQQGAVRQPAGPGPGGPNPVGPGPGMPWNPGRPAPRNGAEASAPGVQNLLLIFGGLLLTVAALAFTLVSWGHLGIGGRATVLGLVTLAALAAPAALLRRRLRSTAHAVAGLGLALTLLDAYALHRTAFPDAAPAAFAAVSCAVLSAVWAGYGRALPGLRHPLPAAVVLAQAVLPLLAVDQSAGPRAWSCLLLLQATADLGLAVYLRPVRLTAAVTATTAFLGGLALAAQLSADATGTAPALLASALLTWAAALALAAALKSGPLGLPLPLAALSGLLTTAATGGVVRSLLPQDWAAPGYLACALAVAVAAGWTYGANSPAQMDSSATNTATETGASATDAATTGATTTTATSTDAPATTEGAPTPPPAPAAPAAPPRADVRTAVRQGLLGAAACVLALVALWALPAPAHALLSPLELVDGLWQGAPDRALPPAPELPAPAPALTVFAALAAVAHLLGRTARQVPQPLRDALGPTALGLLWLSLYCLPAWAQLPYSTVVLGTLALCAALLLLAAHDRSRPRSLTALGLALLSSLNVTLLSLADEPWTLTVLAALTVLYAAASALSRARGTLGAVGLAGALVWATAFLVAAGFAADLPPAHTALLVLLVPAAAVGLARLVRDTAAARLSAEGAGVYAAVVALGLAATEPWSLSLVLALCGVLASASALQHDRRKAGYAATVLFVLALWVRLAAWEVEAPEAYTLPVSVPALVIGLLRRRRQPGLPSWTAYGPGLGATLLPSLVAAWTDTGWQRPLLLGLAALAVTLVGARHRLLAPLLIGGTVLSLDALHELAPYIVQLTGALPRWVLPALAGLLLLVVGATYERRLRDARRLRSALARMR